MDKNRSHFLARFRGLIQAGAALLTNIHLPNFLKGTLYQGKGKYLCVPGLNCYSCPGAAGACPIGAFQAVVGSSKFRVSYYVTGILILLGVLLGRFICGFLCPFGWLQELLHKIPSPKLSTRRTASGCYCQHIRHGGSVLLQVPVSAGRTGGRNSAFSYKRGHTSCFGKAVQLEILHSAGSCGRQRGFLPPVLQMAVPLGGGLCTYESCIPVSDAR